MLPSLVEGGAVRGSHLVWRVRSLPVREWAPGWTVKTRNVSSMSNYSHTTQIYRAKILSLSPVNRNSSVTQLDIIIAKLPLSPVSRNYHVTHLYSKVFIGILHTCLFFLKKISLYFNVYDK